MNMSSENSEILIRALEASGSEREAKLARAILGEAPAAQPAVASVAPVTPAVGAPTSEVPALPAEVQVLAAASTGPPSGLTRADLRTMSAQTIAKLPRKDVDEALRGGV